MKIIAHKIRLCFNDEPYCEFIRLYAGRAKTCCVIYNWAVCEYTGGDCRAYLQVDGKPCMDKTNRNLAKQVAEQAGVGYILNLLIFRRDEFMVYDNLCTISWEVVYVRSKFLDLGCSQTARQPARTRCSDWNKPFIARAHNDINKQKIVITHAFFRKVQYEQI